MSVMDHYKFFFFLNHKMSLARQKEGTIVRKVKGGTSRMIYAPQATSGQQFKSTTKSVPQELYSKLTSIQTNAAFMRDLLKWLRLNAKSKDLSGNIRIIEPNLYRHLDSIHFDDFQAWRQYIKNHIDPILEYNIGPKIKTEILGRMYKRIPDSVWDDEYFKFLAWLEQQSGDVKKKFRPKVQQQIRRRLASDLPIQTLYNMKNLTAKIISQQIKEQIQGHIKKSCHKSSNIYCGGAIKSQHKQQDSPSLKEIDDILDSLRSQYKSGRINW